jgi:hypothetical protein
MTPRVFLFLLVLSAFAALVVVLLSHGVTAAAATGMVMTLAGAAVTVVLRLTGSRDTK